MRNIFTASNDGKRQESLVAAAEWLLRLENPRISQEEYGEWLLWIEADTLHEEAFDEVAALSGRVERARGQLADIPLPSDEDIAGDDYDGSVSVAAWLGEKALAERGKSLWLYAAAATIALAATGLGILALSRVEVGMQSLQPYGFETVASQHDEARLEDGSKIDIGAESALTVSFSKEQRTVVFEKGEALFSVAKDAERPFVVVAGSGTIRAIGTEFNVRRDSERVVVTVTEGSVEVSRLSEPGPEGRQDVPETRERDSQNVTRLGMGQQVAYDALGLMPVSAADPAIATSWREGRLQFLREPLQYVVTGVNRYSDLNIVIADADVNSMLFTGTVFDGQSREWLEGLASVLPVQVEYVGNNTALLKKSTTQQ